MQYRLTKIIARIVIIIFFSSFDANAQKQFFCSGQIYDKTDLDRFYSSLSVEKSLILFVANDYTLYAYDKKEKTLMWSYPSRYKSVQEILIADSVAYVSVYVDEVERSALLNIHTGKLIKLLPFGPFASKPFIKGGILYSTAIYDYGCIIAYDLKKDTVIWSRFLAHGYSHQPYYLEDKILANAEGDNWVSLSYSGDLLDTSCNPKANIFVSDIPCVENFVLLTHDNFQIKRWHPILHNEDYGIPENLLTKKRSFVYYDENLYIISDNLKLQTLRLSEIVKTELSENSACKLLQAVDDTLWFLYGNTLIQYNFKSKKVIASTDLTAWDPYKVVVDGSELWMISRKDGLLYGLSL